MAIDCNFKVLQWGTDDQWIGLEDSARRFSKMEGLAKFGIVPR